MLLSLFSVSAALVVPSMPAFPARALSRVAQPTMLTDGPTDDFRFGTGGPIQQGGGAAIGFQGGWGHGNGDDEKADAIAQAPVSEDFRFGTGGPIQRGGGAVIGFQGGWGHGNGDDAKATGAVLPTFADDFRFGTGGGNRGVAIDYRGGAATAVGWPGNGAPSVAATPTVAKVEDKSTADEETDEAEESMAQAEADEVPAKA